MRSEEPIPPQKEHVSEVLDPPSKQQRFDSTETIVVCAGRAKKEFLVYNNMLSSSSSRFFNGMLSNDWGETCEKRLSLPETRPELIGVYLHWMYTGNVILEPGPVDASTERRTELYIFGDYLDDMTFCEESSKGSSNYLADLSTSFPAHWRELSLGVPIKSTVEAFSNNDEFPHEFILELLSVLVGNNKNYCKRSISHKSDAQIREACKGLVKSADQKRLSSTIGVQNASENDA